MNRTTRTLLALTLAASGTTLAASQTSAVPIDPSYKPKVVRTWHPQPSNVRHVRTWHPKPCQTWPRPTGCPSR